jgi:hypothetical protein
MNPDIWSNAISKFCRDGDDAARIGELIHAFPAGMDFSEGTAIDDIR